jgi:hypothetical protein
MDRILRPNLTQVNNVAIGAQWTCDLPIGPTYRYLDVLTTMTPAAGLTTAAITDFSGLTYLNANGNAFRTFTGQEADKIYNRYGANFPSIIGKSSGSGNTLVPLLTNGAPTPAAAAMQTTCIQRLYFEEPWRDTWAAAASRKFHTSWPSAKAGGASQVLNSFQIQGFIPATANNLGATSLSVLIYAGTDSSQGQLDANGAPITNTLKWQRYPGFPYTAAGDLPMNNLVKVNKGKELAILEEMDFFSQSTGDDINRLLLQADGATKYDAPSLENYHELVRHGFNPNAWDLDQYAYVADANDQITDGLYLSTPNGAYINTLTATVTLTAAAGANKTINVISQVLGPLG